MIEPVWLVAFTGHRPADEDGRRVGDLGACRGAIGAALGGLREKAAARRGHVELVVGAAAGADIEAAEVAHDLGIPVHVVLPMAPEGFVHDFEGQSASYLARAEAIIARASAGEDGWSIRVVSGEPRPSCYHDAGLQMLACADALVAVWNGTAGVGVGGTSEIIDEARRLEIPSILIDPRRPDAGAGDALGVAWPAPEPVFDAVHADIVSARVTEGEEEGVAGLRACLDSMAMASAGHFRTRLVLSLVLHFVAALLAAITASCTPVISGYVGAHHDAPLAHWLHLIPKVLTGIEFGLVLVAWYLMFQALRRRSHEHWRRRRFAAEIVRGLVVSSGLIDPLWPLVGRYDERWRRFGLTVGLAASRETHETDVGRRRDAYLNDRIVDQLGHYSQKLRPASAWMHRLGTLGALATVAAPVVIGLAFVLKLFTPELPERALWAAVFVSFLPVALPLIAGASTSLLVSMDASRRTERYSTMVSRLRRLSELLPGVKTEGTLRRIAVETEGLLLDELVEWHAASKHIGH